MLRNAVFTGLLFVALPVPARSQGFATPPPDVLAQLRHQHHRKDWLRVTTESTRWELRAGRIDEQGLSRLTIRHAPRPRPERIAWSTISRIDVCESGHRYGQLTGLVLGGVVGAAGAGAGVGLGALAGAWVGGQIGNAFQSERPVYLGQASAPPPNEAPVSAIPASAAPDSAATPDRAAVSTTVPSAPPDSATSPHLAPVSAVAPPNAALRPERLPAAAEVSEPVTSSFWVTGQSALSQPVGSFRPAGQRHAWGWGFQTAIVPARGSIGARFDVGSASYSSLHEGLTADVFGNGSGVSLLGVTTETDLYWVMAGPQWGAKARHSGVYLYGTVGVVHVGSRGSAPWGTNVHYDMPGVPPGGTSFASSVGGGLRVLLGKSKRIAITTELGYERGGEMDYIGAPGVEESYPNTHFSARRGTVETVTWRAGLARQWGRR